MEKIDVLAMDGVGPIALIDGKEDINEVPHLTLVDDIEGLAILDDALMSYVM
jgi:hypothetical protein